MTEETKTDEPKDVRLPFMVTASEAKAIDEWRYKNHIPSRAEAMRILINRGLLFDPLHNTAADIIDIICKNLSEAILKVDEIGQLHENVISFSNLSKQAYKETDEILDLTLNALNKLSDEFNHSS